MCITTLCAALAGFCKQQLWPLFHYLLPLSPLSASRFDPRLWQSYVKANKVRPSLQGSASPVFYSSPKDWQNRPDKKIMTQLAGGIHSSEL